MTNQPGAFERIYTDLQAITDHKQRGDAFEKVVLYFLKNDPRWQMELGETAEIYLWSDAPADWRWQEQDLGTDLLAKDSNGDMWAFQAKGWNYHRAVTKDHGGFDSFLADTSRPEVTHRVFITTSKGLAENAQKTARGQEKPLTILAYGALEKAEIDWPESLAALLLEVDGPPKPRTPRTPRGYQNTAIDAVTNAFTTGTERGQLVMACGTGKTLTSQRIMERLDVKTVIVFFPSLMLLGQTLRSWTRDAEFGKEFDWLAVCSDHTVSRGNKNDDIADSLADAGITNVTTSPTEIAEFLTRPNRRPLRIIFSTYQSSPRIADAVPYLPAGFQFDLMICDEAHKMARVGKGTRSETAAFTLPAEQDSIPAARRLFMTATPKVYGQTAKTQAKDADLEHLLYSMDDSSKFGPIVHEYTFRQAIKDDVLADYRVLGIVVTESEIREHLTNRSYVAVTGENGKTLTSPDMATLATQIAVMKAMQDPEYNIHTLITFHNTIKAARDFQAEHNIYRAQFNLSAIPTAIVEGADPADKRTEKLRILTVPGQDAIVSNARCLTEGIDVPLLDGVAFIEPKSSKVDIVQAIGRAIRKPNPEKTIGYVIVPVFVSEDLERTIAERGDHLTAEDAAELSSKANESFTAIIEVLNALRGTDGTLMASIDDLRTEKGARCITPKPPKPITPVPDVDSDGEAEDLDVTTNDGNDTPSDGGLPVDITFKPLKPVKRKTPKPRDEEETIAVLQVATDRLNRAVRLLSLDAVIDACSETWWERLGQVSEWVKVHGEFPRVSSEDELERALRNWVAGQRAAYRKGNFDSVRVEALELIPGWRWEPQQEQWSEAFTQLVQFIRDNEGRYPSFYAGGSERELRRWVNTQRETFRKGKLSPERAEALNGIEGWEWDPHVAKWEEGFSGTRRFLSDHGHFPRNSGSADKAERELGRWVGFQREMLKKGNLLPERLARLNEALPGWNTVVESVREQAAAQWFAHADVVEQYVHEHAGYPSMKGTAEEVKLSRWVASQRVANKKGKLTADKVERLERVPGWTWNMHDAKWNDYASELERFLTVHGRAPVTSGNEGEAVLARWFGAQKRALRSGTLSPERAERLKSIKGWE